MDEVDLEYKNEIMESLNEKDVNRLMSLIPDMEYERALECVDRWHENMGLQMASTRMGEDTTELESEALGMLYDLLDEAKLSGFHK